MERMTFFSLALAAAAVSASSQHDSSWSSHNNANQRLLGIVGGSSSSRREEIGSTNALSRLPSVSSLSTTTLRRSVKTQEGVRILAQGYYDDEHDYDEDGYVGGRGGSQNRGQQSKQRKPQPKYQPRKGGLESLMEIGSPETRRKVGAMLMVGGGALTLIGMTLFFERNLLRLGNICILLGIPLLIGPSIVYNFFMQPQRAQATIITAMGIFLVFIGKPRLGILMEIFGLLNLLGNMLPLLLSVAKRLPIIGDVITSIEQGATGGGGGRKYGPEF